MDNVNKHIELMKRHHFKAMLNTRMNVTFDTDDVPPLPNPDQTGTLAANDIQTLYAVASFGVTKWTLDAAYNKFDYGEFENFVGLKTGQTPSYFTAYNQVLTLYNVLVGQMGQEAALNYLYTPSPSVPPENWEVVRYWGIQEFLNLMIVSGNFMSYGWKNFPGWMGGPYNNPNNLPYRT